MQRQRGMRSNTTSLHQAIECEYSGRELLIPVLHCVQTCGMTSSMKGSTPRAHKFTISLPERLFEQGEQERQALGLNRSEYVASLYRDHLDEAALQARIARYREAYAKLPSTEEEDDWIQLSEQALALEEF